LALARRVVLVERGFMKTNTILWAAGAVIVLAVVVLRTQRNARRELEQERGYVEILEWIEGGHAEHYTRILPLVEGNSKKGERISWYAAAFADPVKPKFALNFRNVAELRDEWGKAAKQPIALWVEDRRYQLKPYQALLRV
jgi:hypothetical protein